MLSAKLRTKIIEAAQQDPEIISEKEDLENTLGSDARYLEEVLGITKSDLIRLEREGLAVKCRYATQSKRHYFSPGVNEETKEPEIKKVQITGPHRVRWIIFRGAME